MDPTMDLLQGVKENMKGVGDVAAGLGGVDGGVGGGSGDFEMPSLEKLMEMIEGMDMSDEEKSQIKENLMGKGDVLSQMGQYQNTIPSPVGGDMNPNTAFIVFLAALIIITFILGEKCRHEMDDNLMSEDEVKKVVQGKVDDLQEKLATLNEKIAVLTEQFKTMPKKSAKSIDMNVFGDNYITFIVAFIIILVIFVFFGYKLYKSLIEKERKREEKRKLKQQKKKK